MAQSAQRAAGGRGEGLDRWGVPVIGSPRGIGLLDEAVEQLVALSGDPVAAARRAVEVDDGLVLAQVLQAYLLLYATTATANRQARGLLDGLGDPGAGGRRETLHVQAARAWADGDWAGAARLLGRALERHPRDLLALKIAQDLWFFLGHGDELRDVVKRVLPAWGEASPGWGYVQGMYAFGLEEHGQYREAEQHALAALAHNPRDVWAVHARTHVFEMEGSFEAGADFLTQRADDWASSYFAVHNWWHLALFELELGSAAAALARYDNSIRGSGSTTWLDLDDAAALLWRLSLFGVDLGDRAARLAADVADLMDGPIYLFNDWHAVMAFGLAGQHEHSQQLLTANRRHSVGTNRMVVEQAGAALLEGFSAFAAGRYGQAVDRLIEVGAATVVGGSHAQRDVIDLTRIAAACRAGRDAVARSLVAQRVVAKPGRAVAARRLLAANLP
jgi:tetratricopeptide (TPR) repeat protein